MQEITEICFTLVFIIISWKYKRPSYVMDIRECGSTLYVGLAHAVSPTNTNFRLTFLLTRLLSMKTYLDRA